MNPVRPHKKVTTSVGPVGEPRDHAAVRRFSRHELLAWLDPDPSSKGFAPKRAVQMTAFDRHADRAIRKPEAVGDLAEALAGSTPHHHARRREAAGEHSGVGV